MPRQNNFIIGNGHQLKNIVPIPRSGGPKRRPYSFDEAKDRLAFKLETINKQLENLPKEAKPRDETVLSITLHPRFVSKSDHPKDFLDRFNLIPVGSKADYIRPEQWGAKSAPLEEVHTDIYFVKGPLKDINHLMGMMPELSPDTVNEIICYIEDITLDSPEQKFQGSTDKADISDKVFLECILHGGLPDEIHEYFFNYLNLHQNIVFNSKKIRTVGGLTFVPIMASVEEINFIGEFTFLRAFREMPQLRPFKPTLLRSSNIQNFVFDNTPIFNDINAVIFDGGLPETFQNMDFIDYLEIPNIGNPIQSCVEHGLGVTGAYLFGILDSDQNILKPLSKVTHVRVLGEKQQNPLTIEDIDLYDVIDGIVNYLEENKPDFANLSLGPNSSVDDNEVSYWTAKLDKYASENSTLITVAAGNNGSHSDIGNLNRVQIPADAVNILSVGSADSQGDTWNRAHYSALGPGRNPGIIKPDILCFGGSEEKPFYVLASHNNSYEALANAGTSFAAPLAMRQAAKIYGNFKDSLNLLSVRALLIHQAQNNNLDCKEVGWGKCNEDSDYLITCEDNEVTIIYHDTLDVAQYTRLPLPLKNVTLDCEIEVKSTIVAKTEVDPSFSATYTKSGFEVVFRPDSQNIVEDSQYQYAKPKTFFKNKLPPIESETLQKAKGAKWECVRREEITLRKFSEPVCDIVSHHRAEGKNEIIKQPIEMSCIITIKAKKGIDLYNRVIRSYQSILLPIVPRIATQIKL